MSSDPNHRGVQTDGNGGRAGASGAGGGSPSSDSLLSTIHELESRFGSLKQLHEESVRRDLELNHRAEAVARLEAEVRQQAATIEERRDAVALLEQEGKRCIAEAASERKVVEQLRLEAEERERELSAREMKAREEESGIAARLQRLGEQARGVEESRAAAMKLEEHLAEREHVVAEQDRKIAERERRAAEDEKKNATAEFRLVEQRQTVGREVEASAERERKLAGRESQIGVREAEVEGLKKRFAEQAVRVAEREEALDKAANELAAERQAVQAELNKVGLRERELSEREQAAATAQQEHRATEQRASERMKELAGAEATFAEREEKVATLESAVWERDRAVVEREATVAMSHENLEEQEKALAELEQGLKDREREVQEERAAMMTRETEVAERQAAHAEELRAAREELANYRHELDERETKVRENEVSVRDRLSEVRRQADKVERDRVAVAEQAKTLTAAAGEPHHGGAIFSGRMEQVQIQLGEANAKRASVETELLQARKEISRLFDELRGLTSAVNKSQEASRGEVARRESALAELETELAESRQTIKDMTERLAKTERAAANTVSQEQIAERDALVAELRGKLKEAGGVNKSLNQRLEEASMMSKAVSNGDERVAMAEIAKRDQAIAMLKQRLDQAEEHASNLADTLEAMKAAGPFDAQVDDRGAEQERCADPATRRERLRRYKSLLQSQARKIVTAQTALAKRHADCEQVLHQRARLANIAAEITRREKKIDSAKARSGASAALLYAVATLAILGVISWQVAGQLWPGTYVATAVVEADTHGRQPNETELATWQNYHTQLLENPAMIEMAAERMARRGIVQYGSPAELRAKLKADLYHQSSMPGSLTIELKHEGAEKSKTVLDTFITSLKSISDAQRDQRPDDLGIVIAQAATVGAEPLSDARLERAGALLAGGALAAGLFGMVIWSRLARAKHTFEHAQAVDSALNEVDWGAIEQTYKKGVTPVERADSEVRKGRKKG